MEKQGKQEECLSGTNVAPRQLRQQDNRKGPNSVTSEHETFLSELLELAGESHRGRLYCVCDPASLLAGGGLRKPLMHQNQVDFLLYLGNLIANQKKHA